MNTYLTSQDLSIRGKLSSGWGSGSRQKTLIPTSSPKCTVEEGPHRVVDPVDRDFGLTDPSTEPRREQSSHSEPGETKKYVTKELDILFLLLSSCIEYSARTPNLIFIPKVRQSLYITYDLVTINSKKTKRKKKDLNRLGL